MYLCRTQCKWAICQQSKFTAMLVNLLVLQILCDPAHLAFRHRTHALCCKWQQNVQICNNKIWLWHIRNSRAAGRNPLSHKQQILVVTRQGSTYNKRSTREWPGDSSSTIRLANCRISVKLLRTPKSGNVSNVNAKRSLHANSRASVSRRSANPRISVRRSDVQTSNPVNYILNISITI